MIKQRGGEGILDRLWENERRIIPALEELQPVHRETADGYPEELRNHPGVFAFVVGNQRIIHSRIRAEVGRSARLARKFPGRRSNRGRIQTAAKPNAGAADTEAVRDSGLHQGLEMLDVVIGPVVANSTIGWGAPIPPGATTGGRKPQDGRRGE